MKLRIRMGALPSGPRYSPVHGCEARAFVRRGNVNKGLGMGKWSAVVVVSLLNACSSDSSSGSMGEMNENSTSAPGSSNPNVATTTSTGTTTKPLDEVSLSSGSSRDTSTGDTSSPVPGATSESAPSEPAPSEPAPSEPTPDVSTSDADSSSATANPGSTVSCPDGPLEQPLPDCRLEFEETGDYYADCVARINQFRWECQCLPPLDRYPEAESCADQQAQYDFEVDRAHAGISDEICEPGGSAQNECPGYGGRFGIVDFCLQQMWDEGPGEDFQAHGHYINMSSLDFSRVACGTYTTPDGEIWAVQNFFR